ncbi:Met-10+ like-protein-domain-containing protein [Pseudomassariella vexata]|uniref:tRNA (guanine(37)-N1)-methyltransferase n=1 Tax=Pseudomassariella vexata TaxID=1141098 RepID=A0A1Y2E4D1_9PEZI|nr:Met-10+ like-protein-domain-containing protein [Pseudomassariella vexata]ORY66382.1 Met-10+ like-protein-domain-containing protein [Pseudomassariella vexata]
MSFSSRDTELYREDQRAGHRLLQAQQREELAKRYLPETSRFGVRKFFRQQLYEFSYAFIHALFSVYIRIRIAYHAIIHRIWSILRYHHRDPQYIKKDVEKLSRKPNHVSVILTLENGGKRGDAIEKLINEVADVAAWCKSAGIPLLSVYEKRGALKNHMPYVHRIVNRKLQEWFGKFQAPVFHLHCRGEESIHPHNYNVIAGRAGAEKEHFQILLLSAEDGRESMVDLTKVFAVMAQRSKLSAADITADVIDNELTEAVMAEPDLLVSFSPFVDLQGYPPWQIRLTEIYCKPDNQGVGYQSRCPINSNDCQQATASKADMNLFRPSTVRPAAGVLNRSLFARTIPLAAATVAEKKNIAKYRQALAKTKELLALERIAAIAPHPDQALASQGQKCLLLSPTVKSALPETWGPSLKEGVDKSELGVIPFSDVISALLPPELHDEIPTGFNAAGHVAHLNLREQYLPYKKLIGEILVDKNAHIRTVINKVDNVGTESEFRTFAYEVLAGPDDMDVEVRENGCIFHFDYSKVYWNSKLEAEHTRLINMFQPGEVVCDVMAGIGPFAVPAGKKGVFVWANDMNPESHHYLAESIKRNKVGQYVRPFNEDGRAFIHHAADSVYAASITDEHAVTPRKTRRHRQDATANEGLLPPPQKIPVPPTIAHFVMNLPASAYTFVHHYRGLYANRAELFEPHTKTKLPMVHVHCFALKSDDDVPRLDICERLSTELGMKVVPGDGENAGEVSIYDVRDVAPAKRMFCASFRLPHEVAFAPRT